jgi:tetratricopeptide (TPR) repeat protein
MRLHKFVLIIFSALLLCVSQPWWFSFSPAFGKSAVVAQMVDARKAEANRLFKQGNQQFQKSEFKAALRSWEQALQIYREIQDLAGEGAVLDNLGIACSSLADYQKAIDFHQQSLAIAIQMVDLTGVGGALGNLGNTYRYLGDYTKAIDFYQQALDIFKQIGDRTGVGRVLGNLGNAYYSLVDYQKVY